MQFEGGKKADLEYLTNNVAKPLRRQRSVRAHVRTKKRAKFNPSGPEITGQQYLMEIDAHEEELDKENLPPKVHDKGKKPSKNRSTITTMP